MKIKAEAGITLGRTASFFGSATLLAAIAEHSIRKSVITWAVAIVLIWAAFISVAVR